MAILLQSIILNRRLYLTYEELKLRLSDSCSYDADRVCILPMRN